MTRDPNTLTPLQALVKLLAECERGLDFRPSFRHAMSDAHAAIVNAPAVPAVAESIETSEDDCALSFPEWQARRAEAAA